MRKLAVAVGAVTVLLVGGVVAFAQTTGDERIYACVNNGDGTIRQVASATTACSKGWHKLSWSQENAPAETIPTTTTYRKEDSRTFFAGTEELVVVHCNDGDVATGGGFGTIAQTVVLKSSRPIGSNPPNAWLIFASNEGGTDTLNTYVVCQHTE